MFATTQSNITPLMMNQVQCHLDAEEYVCTLEIELDICPRWTESNEEYQEFYQKTVVTNYSKALDELKCLVIMCLFELAKMSMSGIGKKYLSPLACF